MWHAFGNLGHWTEWHAQASDMRAAIALARPRVAYYGNAIIEHPTDDLAWFMGRPMGFSKREYTIRPYKPLQSDWGVKES